MGAAGFRLYLLGDQGLTFNLNIPISQVVLSLFSAFPF